MSPILELIGAVVPRLKSALSMDRVYDRVPPSPTYPYISLGDVQELNDSSDNIIASEISIRMDVWSMKPGYSEALGLAEAVRDALDQYELALQDNALVFIDFTRISTVQDEDPLISHVVVEFTTVVEQP
jgi:hypothetical protein